MVITLVGLSGCGKSHLAKRLAADKGFRYIGCDDRIEARLASQSSDAKSRFAGISSVADWLGQPWTDTYRSREAQYLSLEAEVMCEIIASLGEDGWGLDEDVVIDTTGSVIYLDPQIQLDLKKRSRIIYFSVPKNEYQMMFDQYFLQPKPVIWGESFTANESESTDETLRRCYPQLIEFRAQRYQQLAEVTVVMDRTNRDRLSTTRFLQLAGAR